MKADLRRKTIRGSLVLFINIIVFGLFFMRDILAARYFGLSSTLDSLFLGIMVPTLVSNFLFQPLHDFLIPKYQYRIHHNSGVMNLYLNVLYYSVFTSLFIIVATFLMQDFISNLVAHGFSYEQQKVVTFYMIRSMSILALGGIIISTNILLNSLGLYIQTSIVGAIVPFSAIIYVYFMGKTDGEISFIYGIIIGQVLNLLLLNIFLFSEIKKRNFKLQFKLIKLKPSHVRQYTSQNIVSLCYYGFNAIGASFGTHFHEGTASLVILVNKVISFFTNLFNNTFSSVLMPYFSRLFLGNENQFNKEKRSAYYLLTISGAIAALVISLFAKYISMLLFFSSKISQDHILDFETYIKLGSFQIPLFISIILSFKWMTIKSNFKGLVIFSVMALICDFLLIYTLRWNQGILSILTGPVVTLCILVILINFFMFKEKIGLIKKDLYFFTSFWITFLAIFLLTLKFKY